MLTTRTKEDLLEDVILSTKYPEVSQLNVIVDEAVNSVEYSIRTKDNVYLGSCMLFNTNLDVCWLGIQILNQPYWDKGYGTQTVNSLCQIAKGLHVSHVWLRVLKTNARAIRCYEKCGFTKQVDQNVYGHEFVLMERNI